MNLVESLIKNNWLKTPIIIEAFKKVKREEFVLENMRDMAELNEALPIGFGQTISQPLVVAFMLEQLAPKLGDKILDIGSGSGWTSALLAEIVGSQGKVIAIELIPELKELGEKNAAKYEFIEKGIVKFICADGSKGYQSEAPFNAILASASAQELPEEWKKQLKAGGRVVAPIKNSIWVFIKKSENDFEELEYPGFAFVPLISDK